MHWLNREGWGKGQMKVGMIRERDVVLGLREEGGGWVDKSEANGGRKG